MSSLILITTIIMVAISIFLSIYSMVKIKKMALEIKKENKETKLIFDLMISNLKESASDIDHSANKAEASLNSLIDSIESKINELKQEIKNNNLSKHKKAVNESISSINSQVDEIFKAAEKHDKNESMERDNVDENSKNHNSGSRRKEKYNEEEKSDGDEQVDFTEEHVDALLKMMKKQKNVFELSGLMKDPFDENGPMKYFYDQIKKNVKDAERK